MLSATIASARAKLSNWLAAFHLDKTLLLMNVRNHTVAAHDSPIPRHATGNLRAFPSSLVALRSREALPASTLFLIRFHYDPALAQPRPPEDI